MKLDLMEIILLFILIAIGYDCIKRIINGITVNKFMKNLSSLPDEERTKIIKSLSVYLTRRK